MSIRGSQPLLIGFVVLLGLMSSANIVEGQRLAEQKCNEYRKITTSSLSLIPLTAFAKPIEVKSNNCSNFVQLISGGVEAKPGAFPHHALLGFPKENSREYNFQCSGTLISDQHVLTAAHCFKYDNPKIVRLGEDDTSVTSEHEYDADIEDNGIRKHPMYKNSELYHDIALVKLANRVYFNSFIRPACLWTTDQRNTSKFIATGFGTSEYGGPMSKKMMEVELQEFPSERCLAIYKYDSRFDGGFKDDQLCVGGVKKGADTCQGDSGGPLQTVTDAGSCIYHVVGITSVGTPCGNDGTGEAIYTKVSHYIDWIEDNVWGANAL